jgi:enoyl reductase-like protein
MSAAAIVTLVIVGLVVLSIAGFLVAVIGALNGVLTSLVTIESAVRLIADRAGSAGPALDETNADLAAVADRLDQLVGAETTERMTVGQ